MKAVAKDFPGLAFCRHQFALWWKISRCACPLLVMWTESERLYVKTEEGKAAVS